VELYCDTFEDGGFEAMRTMGPSGTVMDIETGEVQRR